MARNKYYKYRTTDPGIGLPKKGFIYMEERDPTVAIFDRLLKVREINKYKLIDLNTDVKKLTKYRASIGMKQADLAEQSGVSIKTIQAWEFYGINGGAVSKVVKVADVLGIKDIRVLLEDE